MNSGSIPLRDAMIILDIKRMQLMKKILSLLVFVFICFHISPNTSIKKEIQISFLNAELNDSTLYLALVHYDIKHPKKVLAQAKLESGNYTSYHCRKKNNFLGLYNSKKGEYFKFNHWTDCIQGYKDMVEYKLRDGEDYYDFLVRIKYASSPDYVRKVKQIERVL